jgi:23S rRNA (adenine2503-C2)-methyltransferase
VNQKTLIYDLDQTELQKVFSELGEPTYRVGQLWNGIYRHYWRKADEISTFPKSLRTQLEKRFSFSNLCPIETLTSSDGETEKVLFQLPDKQAVETVLMRYKHRRTLCISTQAGCAMGCVFCATGQMGFRRNLTSGEIIEQVLYFARKLELNNERVTNVVVMGMGEPFHNYEATLEAIDRLNHPDGINLGTRRFTISTVGLVPMIRKFAAENRQINLAISLHATENDLRSSMLPINKRYPIEDLIAACRDYLDTTHRRITFEWALIKGTNDSPEQAIKLANLIGDMLCHVNIIPLNPTEGYSGQATSQEQAAVFQSVLQEKGIPCTIRTRRGIDIQAGCGQLAIQNLPS